MNGRLLYISLLSIASLAVAQVDHERAASEHLHASPTSVQLERAAKIVASIKVDDSSRAQRVRDIIANEYGELSIIHAKRDGLISAAKAETKDKRAIDIATAAAKAEAETAQDKLHAAFLASLGAELTPEQVEKVKDGMTYGVVPLTFKVYQQMLPELTQEQKAQILAWLVEAREHAMDASTSEEKHAWFGKYKGRINNYLAKAGFDMKAAEKNLTKKS